MANSREPLAGRIGRRLIGRYCARAVRTSVDLEVEGRDHLPATGPVILAARHVHHLLDGCILTGITDRPVHILVAVDWTRPGLGRRLLDTGASFLRWPTIIRDESRYVEDTDDVARRLRTTTRTVIEVLRGGGAVLVFPEGYPNIDPHPNAKTGIDDMLPFRPGFARLAKIAERALGAGVPVVPVGLCYQVLEGGRWKVVVRFGAPLDSGEMPPDALIRLVEQSVHALSKPAPN